MQKKSENSASSRRERTRVSGDSLTMAKKVGRNECLETGEERPSCVLQPPALQSVAHEVGPTVQAELLHRTGLVRLDGFDAQAETAGNLLIALARGDQAHHLDLPVTQITPHRNSFPRCGTHTASHTRAP